MRTAINITGELKYILDNEKHHVVVPFHTLQASELIKQDVELLNHDYSVALYGFRYEAETTVGTFRYFFLVEHSMAGFRPYAVYHDLPDNVKPLRDTIDFSLLGIAEPPKPTDTEQVETEQASTASAQPPSLWRRLSQKYLPDSRLDKDQRRQQRRSGRLLVALAIVCAAAWALSHSRDQHPHVSPYLQSMEQLNGGGK
ncbi:hypothetical protein [Zymobacter sp. IVIA_5232.4 C2]|uniref:hypothetical protein n=1 Tax=Zymobacter sp. IVIA_5232.4 C2 TaxID=3394855 RepID=UPI0039C1BFEF